MPISGLRIVFETTSTDDNPEIWKKSAACRGMDVNLFYPKPYKEFKAKHVCNSCTVRQECLDYAFDIGDKDGVYGGMTHSQRQKYRYRRR